MQAQLCITSVSSAVLRRAAVGSIVPEGTQRAPDVPGKDSSSGWYHVPATRMCSNGFNKSITAPIMSLVCRWLDTGSCSICACGVQLVSWVTSHAHVHASSLVMCFTCCHQNLLASPIESTLKPFM